jgi:hypothetical protein
MSFPRSQSRKGRSGDSVSCVGHHDHEEPYPESGVLGHLAVAASATLPLVEICVRPRHTYLALAVHATDAAVILGTWSRVALR